MDDMVGGSFDMETTQQLIAVPSQVNALTPLLAGTWQTEVVRRSKLAGFSRDIVPGTWMTTIPQVIDGQPCTKAYKYFIGDDRPTSRSQKH
jgi:hypothetical protein